MTLQEATQEVERIKGASGDYEVAHSLEDQLYMRFIEHVSRSGDEELAPIASKILETQLVDFERYTA